MNKERMREMLLNDCGAAGNAEFELKQLEKLQMDQQPNDLYTITATCSEYYTIICC